MQKKLTGLIGTLLTSFCLVSYVSAQQIATPQARVVQPIEDNTTITLSGNVHPLVANAPGSAADPSTPMQHLILFLKGDDAQEAALSSLVAQQNNPASPLYHHYLKPQDFGTQFGAAPSDVEKVTAWLQSHGFTVEQTPAGQRSIVFSGTAAQVANAFKTEIQKYNVAGGTHYANASDPQIPAALADVVGGIVKLHDFRHGANATSFTKLTSPLVSKANYTDGSYHYLAPADYATIYDINPLYNANINGTGESIAVLARSNISLSDVEAFRSTFGLPANDPQIVITNSDPGIVTDDTDETTLDTEWSGAIAPKASIKVIVSDSTYTDGIDLSALYAVNNDVAPIISLSYGSCEAAMGSSELAFYNSLWEQAAAQGQTVLVSAGDAGAAGCNGGSQSTGSGRAVNGLCSSPYSTCVGGTEFAEGNNASQYWLPGNNSNLGSAISYIPETVWNDSGSNGGSGLWAGGGGASIVYTKPSWQTGVGVPNDGHRDVPDVSLTASGDHDGYWVAIEGGWGIIGGTSASAPSFAGMMALVDQKQGAAQGNANPFLYSMAGGQAAGGAAVFHDVTTGNNTVPGTTGYSATVGYDLASGLGSVDAAKMANNWSSTAGPSINLAASASSVTVETGHSGTVTITSTASSNLKSAVSLSVSGAPTGVTAAFSPVTIASPGSGSSALNIVVSTTAKPGTYSLTVTAKASFVTSTATVSLVIPTPSFTVSASATSLSVLTGSSGHLTVSTAISNGDVPNIALSASGLPTGVAATFSPTSLSGSTAASSTVTFAAAATATPGTYSAKINAVSNGVSQSVTVSLVIPTPSRTFTASATSLTVLTGGSNHMTVSSALSNGAFPTIALSASGLPTGVTASFSPTSLSGSASASSTVTFAAAVTATPGTYSATVNAVSNGVTESVTVSLVIPTPSRTFTASATSLTVLTGSSNHMTVSSAVSNGAFASIALSASGLPTGVTASFSPTSLSGAASASSTVTFAAAATTTPGTYSVKVNGVSNGVTQSATVSLVIPTPSFTFNAGQTSLTVLTGSSNHMTVSSAVSNGAVPPIALSASGLPMGLTASFSPTSLSGASSTSGNVTFTAASTMTPGTYTININAVSNGVTHSATVSLVVALPPSCTLALNPTSLSLTSGQSTSFSASCSNAQGGLSGSLTMTISGAPSGVTIQNPGKLTVGSSATVNLSSLESVPSGTHNLSVAVSGGGFTKTLTLPLTVTAPNVFNVTASPSSVSVKQGSTAQLTLTSTKYGTFDSAVNFTITGLPTGVTATLSKSTLAAPGSGTVIVTFTAASTATTGMFGPVITASSSTTSAAGQTQTLPVSLTIAAK